MSDLFDVAIIGAGMAGLSAARAVARSGARTVLLEASSRVGGRAWTAPAQPDMLPIELGAEFVHGKPKPTLELAREAGVQLLPFADRHFIKRGATFQELSEPWAPFEHVLEQLTPSDLDVSARDFLVARAIDADTGERFRQLVEGFEAAPLEEVSIRSLSTDSDSLSEDDTQSRVAGGYGRLVDFARDQALAAGVELRLRSTVLRAQWRPKGPVSLTLGAGEPEVLARACIIALPLSVLQAAPNAGGLALEPPVDAWQVPLERLAMGHACRVTFQLRGDFAQGAAPNDVFIHQPSSLFETAWSQRNARELQWTVWAGGPKARELAKETEEQRKRLALGALATLLDVPEAALRAALCGEIRHHDFSNDPHARGAYSFCKPGGAHASEQLSAPVANTLFLAGEATDQEYPGTVAGAIASGLRAAEQALAALEID